MADAAQLVAAVKATGVQGTIGELKAVGAEANNTGSIFGKALGVLSLVAVGAAVVGVGVATVKMAGDFQAGMTSLVTGAGEAKSNLKMVSDGILSLAPATGTTTKSLTDGMFMIESAGYHGQAGLDVLKAAAQGAKVGNADLGTVADATTTILNDFGKTGITASNSVNFLIATVANGKTHMQDLAGAMAAVLPTASAVGINLNDVGGAMATMTGEGVPAANAATYLRQTMMALDAPSAGTVKALKGVGLSAKDVADDLKKSLPDTLKMITDAVGKKFPAGSAEYVAALKNIAGGSKQMQGILDLTGDHMATFQGNVKNISGAVKDGGKSITGWSDVQKDFNFKIDKAREVVETLGIKIGTALLPFLGKVADVISANLVPALSTLFVGIGNVVTAIGNFVTWLNQGSIGADAVKVILAAVAITIGVMLVDAAIAAVAALIPLIAAAWAAAAAFIAATLPLFLIALAVAAVIAVIVLLVTHWKQVSAFLENAWAATVATVKMGLSALGHFFGAIFSAIGTTVHNAITAVGNFLKAGFALIMDIVTAPIRAIVALFKWLFDHNTYFHDLVVAIQTEFLIAKAMITTIWHDIVGFLTAVWNGIVSFAQTSWHNLTTNISNAINFVKAVITTDMAIISGIWNRVWGAVSAFVGAIWATISGQITTGVNTAKGIITGIGDFLGTFFGNLATTAIDWGKNLIMGFINGIKNMAGAVKDAVGGVIGGLAKNMGFHSPTEEGPGSQAHTWAPNLMKMFIHGITASIPAIGAAAGGAMGALAHGLMGGVASGTITASMGSSGTLGASSGATGGGGGSTSGGGGAAPIYLVLDGQVIGKALWPHLYNSAMGAIGVH